MNSLERAKLKSVLFDYEYVVKNEGIYRFVSKKDRKTKYNFYFFTFKHKGNLISFYIDSPVQTDLTFLKNEQLYYLFINYSQPLVFSKTIITQYNEPTAFLSIILNYLSNHPQITINE